MNKILWLSTKIYYQLALCFVILSVICSLLRFNGVANFFFLIAGIIAIPNTFLTLISRIKQIWKTDIGRLGLKFLGILAATISYALSIHLIYAATLMDPSNFLITTAMLTTIILPIPIWLTMVAGILFMLPVFILLFGYVCAMLDSLLVFLPIKSLQLANIALKKKLFNIEQLGFMLGCMTIACVLMQGIDSILKQQNFWKKTILYFIIHLDYMEPLACKNVTQDKRINFLKNGDISTVYWNNTFKRYIFEQTQCVSSDK